MKKRFIPILTILLLTGCQSTNSSEATTPSEGTANSSDTSNSSLRFENQIDTYSTPTLKDFTEDYDSQTTEDLFSYTVIDVSQLETTYEITQGGTFVLKNENDNLSIIVSANEDVTLILDNVNITSDQGPAIRVDKAKSFNLKLASKTKNYLKDSQNNAYDGIINVKKTDLNILGTGYLYLVSEGQTTDTIESGIGIYCSKSIAISDSHIQIQANDHAISAKGGLSISSGYLDLNAKGDAIHSKEGGLTMTNSILKTNSLGDGVDVAEEIQIDESQIYTLTEGNFVLYDASKDTDSSLYSDSRYIKDGTTYKKISKDDMNRYQNRYYLESKCKGIKSEKNIQIQNSDINIDSTDDAISSDSDISIQGSKISIKTLDQGLNSEQSIYIGNENTTSFTENLSISIFSSFEGIQGANIHFYDGYTYIVSNDDGINASSDTLSDLSIDISGFAKIVVNAQGDGLDSNGSVSMNGGTLVVYGPNGGGNNALDYDSTFTLTNGELFSFSTPDMIQIPQSSQNLVSAAISSSFSENEILSVSGSDFLYSFILPKAYSQLSFISSSNQYKTGSSYQILKGGKANALFHNGVSFQSVLESSETLYDFTISTTTTSLGSNASNRPGGGFPGGDNRPGRP